MTQEKRDMQSRSKRGLGRGLGALFESEADPSVRPGDRVAEIAINQLEPNREQPRRSFDQAALDDLAASIRDQGVITPLIVTPSDSSTGHFTIVAGERRWRAARLAGLEQVPAIIRELGWEDLQRQALIDNVVRQDLNAVEEAQAYERLMQEFGMTQENLAAALGKSRPAIANTLRLLNLPPAILDLVREGKLSPGHARAILALTDADAQRRATDEILSKQLSVRDTERLIQALKEFPAKKEKKKKSPDDQTRLHIRAAEDRLRRALSARVTLEGGQENGRIVIRYHNADERERLIDLLSRSEN